MEVLAENISVVNKSKLLLEKRMDPEYYQPEFINIVAKLQGNNLPELSKFASVTSSAFYPAATELYADGDVPFIRCVDVIDYPVISKNQPFEKLPEGFLKKHDNIKELKPFDIVVTKVGTPCYAGIIDISLEKVALSRTVLGICNVRGIDPFYLVAFLRSKYGYYQLMRERELTIQMQLTLERVKAIKIFVPPQEEQNNIAKIIKEYFSKEIESNLLYSEAERLLLSQLGAKDLAMEENLTYTADLRDAIGCNRIDAEYFQPKYEKTLYQIQKKCRIRLLGDIVAIKKGIEPGSAYYQDEGIPFIRVSNLSKYELTDNNQQYLTEEFYNRIRKDYQPEINEILLSKDATPGIALVNREEKRMIICGGILRLRLENCDINEEYLALVLNSMIVQLQIERDVGGSIINHWRLDQIKETSIPVLPKQTQDELGDLVVKSYNIRKEARSLLGQAKRKVENMIERGIDANQPC